jgi:hypothetical protein
MKKMLLYVGFGLFSVMNLFAQGQQDASPNDAPVIVLDKTVYDFGTIGYASNGTFEFSVKNTGVQPLIISNVQKSCGCTSVDWTKDPIKQGQSGTIKVTYDTKRTGPFTKNLTVYSNAKTPSVVLTFKGTVENPPATTTTEPTK